MDVIGALAKKDLALLLRDKAGFFFTFFFPLMYAVFFGSVFAGQSEPQAGLAIVVVDDDGTEESRAFTKILSESPELSVTSSTLAEAIDLVRRGKRVAFVRLTEGFGAARGRMFWGKPPHIELGVDPARRAEAGLLQGVLMRYGMSAFQDAFGDPKSMLENTRRARAALDADEETNPLVRATLDRFFGELDHLMTQIPTFSGEGESNAGQEDGYQGWQPLVITSTDVAFEAGGPKNSFEISFPQAIIWGVMGSAAAFGISIVTERTHGTLIRLRMSPIRQSQILAGKAIACFSTTVSVTTGLLVLGVVAFDVQPQSVGLLAMSVISVSWAFTGLMMFLSALGRTEQSAAGIGWAVFTVMAMLGGGMIPLFIMPSWMQSASHVSPVKWAIVALEGAIWRGFSFGEMLTPCGILLAVGVVFFVIGVRTFRWSSSR